MKAGEYIREELTPDGLHPNDKGHKLVAEEIEKFLESVKAELEVEEKEPVFPKAMTENAYENAKRLTIREISPKLCGFHADTEEKTGHLDHFKNGWIGKKAGDSIHFESYGRYNNSSGRGNGYNSILSDVINYCIRFLKERMPEIETAALGNEAGMIGAASLL